ncbi:uncharacterized protein LOC135131526 isoform X2 [Zophobas morio]|uniref:uncharacterized protein LOC135131526 isoform X2 n=1 Tax=Zophobas morio TaxID=2755281 RepID=UPI003082FBFD
MTHEMLKPQEFQCLLFASHFRPSEFKKRPSNIKPPTFPTRTLFANDRSAATHGRSRKMNIHHVLVLLALVSERVCEVLHHEDSVVKVKEEPGPGGLWQTRVQWKAHWVKHWEARKIWIPMWRKVWGPLQVKEWIPFPKTPPPTPPPPAWTPPPR